MRAHEVILIVDWLEGADVIYQINGGWGVDGLVGRQTRPHRDLDIFIDTMHATDFTSWLYSRGYRMVEDWRPVRVELCGPEGRVDVHPMRIDAAGDGFQQGLRDEVFVHATRDRTVGRIGGQAVVVASEKRLRELREGYVPRAIDHHDLHQLDQL